MSVTSGFMKFCENQFRYLAKLDDTEPLYPHDLKKIDDYPDAWPYAIMFANDNNYAIITNNEQLQRLNANAKAQLQKMNKTKFEDMSPNDWYIWKMRNIQNELLQFHTEYQVYYKLGHYDRIRSTLNTRMNNRPSNRKRT